MSWRTLSIVLAVVCMYQAWRGCSQRVTRTPQPTAAACAPSTTTGKVARTRDVPSEDKGASSGEDPADEPAAFGPSINGFKLPAWTLWLAPHPGENMLAYRDRMLPLAQAALAPHRARVARGRDDFANQVSLDSQQRTQLDAAVEEAAGQIQDKVVGAFLSGDLAPSSFKPMTGVTLARDVLDAIDHANRRFVSALREDQKARLAHHPFDFADYLLFSARWEDALGASN